MATPGPHETMIYLMVVTSAADRDMTDAELARIGEVVRTWPVFHGFPADRLVDVARDCQRLLAGEDGLGRILSLARSVLPSHVRDTAYAMAYEVAAADLEMKIEERHVLKLLATHLLLTEHTVEAIALAAKARCRTLS